MAIEEHPAEREMTLAVIKPDAVAAGHAGRIVSMLARGGFQILAVREARLSGGEAAEFYAEHEGSLFFGDLVRFTASGPVIALALARHWRAVEQLRRLAGDTDPARARAGTIRAVFGSRMPANAIHASADDSSALRELEFFFNLLPINSSGLAGETGLWDGCDEPVPAAEIAGAMASEESSE